MKHSLKRFFILTVISLCASFLLYGNSIPGAFVYDDSFFFQRTDMRHPSILFNAFTQPFNPLNTDSGGRGYRPLWVVSLALNYIVFGDSPESFHVVNILLYSATLVVLVYILERLLRNSVLAYCIVAVFAILPIHSEVVANIKSRDELLSLFLLLCSFLLFIRAMYGKTRDPQTLGSALMYGLALLSKESVILGPVIFFLIYRLSYPSTLAYMGKRMVPFIVVLAVYMGLRAAVLGDNAFLQFETPFIQNPLSGASVSVQLSTAMKIAGIYLVKIVVPYNLTASYDFNHIPVISHPLASWESVVGMIGLLMLCAAALFSKDTAVRIGSIWFLVSYFIVSKILINKGSLMAERSIYTPSVGLSVLYGYGLYLLCRQRIAFLLPAIAVLSVVYAGIIIPRNLVWRTPQGFFEQMVIDSPNSVQAHKALAKGYFDIGNLQGAQKHAIRANDLYENDEEVRTLLGKISYISGDFTGCISHMDAVIGMKKSHYDANHFRQLCLVKLGRYQEAIDLASKRLKSVPSDMKIRFVMAAALYKLGKKEEAMSQRYVWTGEVSEQDRETILQDF